LTAYFQSLAEWIPAFAGMTAAWGASVPQTARLAPIVDTAATPLCLLELVATILRLAAVLTVAFNCLSEIFLGLVDALVAVAVVIARPPARPARSQQHYS
jgi:hypothetical protein